MLYLGVDHDLLELVLRGDVGYAVLRQAIVEVAYVGGCDFNVLGDVGLHALCDHLCADGLHLVAAYLLERFVEVFFEFVLSADLLYEVVHAGVDLLYDLVVFDLDAIYFGLVEHKFLNEELLEDVAFDIAVVVDALDHGLSVLVFDVGAKYGVVANGGYDLVDELCLSESGGQGEGGQEESGYGAQGSIHLLS